MNKQKHKSHKSIIDRLMRVNGHILSVVAMIKDEKPCIDVSQQLHAVSKAIFIAKQEYINDHIEHCLEANELNNQGKLNATLKELKQITKYLTN